VRQRAYILVVNVVEDAPVEFAANDVAGEAQTEPTAVAKAAKPA
jgi:hypothetical protein